MPGKWRFNGPSPALRKTWRFLRPFLVLMLSLAITYAVFSFGINFVLDRYIKPVDSNDATPVAFVVEKSDSASAVASKLYNAFGGDEPGLISNTAVFKVYVDFVGKANKLKAGTYILSRNMDIPEIVDIICAGNPPRQTINLKVQEGYTISGVIWSMQQAGLTVDEQEFLRLCNDRKIFETYPFLAAIKENPEKPRDYFLEGYLFPDTYEVFADTTPESVINKMLVRFNEIFTEEYLARAKELDMSIDDVITLASIIEREASVKEDFYKVSAVFHNRLKAGERLRSCATMQYALKVNKYVYTEEELATNSPYNTYMYGGLPAGPISNPGKLAIEAALYPNEEYTKDGYMYFCNMDLPENKALIFAKTLEEHEENVAKYSKYWS